jgi:hypothetical protein
LTLDVYGGKPEWNKNPKAVRRAGAEIERVVEQTIAEDFSGGGVASEAIF